MTAGVLAPGVTDPEAAELADAVRSVLSRVVPPEAPVLDPDDAARLWHSLVCEIGLGGLLVPEAVGGLGLGARAAAAVSEVLGSYLVAGPFAGGVVASTRTLAAIGGPAATALMGDLVDGGDAPTPAWTAYATTSVVGVPCDGDQVELSGQSGPVLDGDLDRVLVLAHVGGELALVLVTGGGGLDVERPGSLDLSRGVVRLTFDRASGDVLARGVAAVAAREAGDDALALAVAADSLGVAERSLRTTTSYLITREQFGRQVGSFQGIKHQLADLLVQVETARSAVVWAASVADNRALRTLAARSALVKATEAAVHVTTESVQLHGGIGFTWEHPAHHLLRRAHANAALLGTPAAHRRALFGLLEARAQATTTFDESRQP